MGLPLGKSSLKTAPRARPGRRDVEERTGLGPHPPLSTLDAAAGSLCLAQRPWQAKFAANRCRYIRDARWRGPRVARRTCTPGHRRDVGPAANSLFSPALRVGAADASGGNSGARSIPLPPSPGKVGGLRMAQALYPSSGAGKQSLHVGSGVTPVRPWFPIARHLKLAGCHPLEYRCHSLKADTLTARFPGARDV